MAVENGSVLLSDGCIATDTARAMGKRQHLEPRKILAAGATGCKNTRSGEGSGSRATDQGARFAAQEHVVGWFPAREAPIADSNPVRAAVPTAKDIMSDQPEKDLNKIAAEEAGTNLIGDFWFFLRTNKKWWLIPLLIVLLLLGLLTFLSTSAISPFIYTLF
jgi:hypothetical protein